MQYRQTSEPTRYIACCHLERIRVVSAMASHDIRVQTSCQVDRYQRANGAVARRGEEGDEGGQCCADTPGGLPVFWVVRGDGQADLGVGLEAAIGREHQKARRLEGVLWREQDAPMVDTTLQENNALPCCCVSVGHSWPSFRSKEASTAHRQPLLNGEGASRCSTCHVQSSTSGSAYHLDSSAKIT